MVLPPLLALRTCARIFPRQRAYDSPQDFSRLSVTGGKFSGRTNDFHEYAFAIHGFFDWRNVVAASVLSQKGDTIVEVGANVGTETRSFLDIVGKSGRVIALEPDPILVERLSHNLGVHDGLTLHNLAAGSSEGTMRFHTTSSTSSSGTGHLVTGDVENNQNLIEVQVTRLDKLLAKVEHIALISIDVEGAELQCLEGTTDTIERLRPPIIIEASPGNLAKFGASLTDLENFFKELDYSVFEFTRFGLGAPSKCEESNWLALPSLRISDATRVSSSIKRAGLLPFRAGF